jgi:hypothetical protein
MGASSAVACVKAAASPMARLDELLPAARYRRAVATGAMHPGAETMGADQTPEPEHRGADEADGRCLRTPGARLAAAAYLARYSGRTLDA